MTSREMRIGKSIVLTIAGSLLAILMGFGISGSDTIIQRRFPGWER